MKKTESKQTRYSRREFFVKSAMVSAPLLGAGLLGGCSHLGKSSSCSGGSKTYSVVSGWPLPGHPGEIKSRGIDTDNKGRIYVAGNAEHPIITIDPNGKFLGDWGGGILTNPHGLRVQDDTVWVTDLDTHMARQFTLQGKLIRSFGVKGKAGDAPEQFNKPTDFAFGPNGDVYISDGYINTRVVVYAPDGSIRRIWGEKGTGPGQFDLVHGIAIGHDKRVYVADRTNNRVQIFDLEGKFLTQWTHVGRPYGFDVCKMGSIFMCGLVPETEKFRVLQLTPDGEVLTEFGETGDGPGQFKMAHSIHVQSDGAVLVADGAANYVQKFTRG